MTRANSVVSTILLGLLAVGCSDPVDLGDPPVLPAAESMEFDLSFFTGGGSPAPGRAPAAVAGTNWITAAASVAIANAAVVIHTVVPVAVWRVAVAQPPVFEDGQWHWRFSHHDGDHHYEGDLAGFIEGDELIAEMRVSASTLGLEDFLWYVGTAPVGGTTGTWEFFDPASPSTVAGMIEWSHPGTAVWTVSFIATTGPNDGDELTYDVNGGARSVSFTDASAGTTALVEWNATTRVGSITAPGFNGGVKSCWDTTLANTTCP